MKPLALAVASGALLSVASRSDAGGFPSSYKVFSSEFQEPLPPLISAEFKANWNQHKWANNISHIASGFLYSSPSQLKVRVDEAYDSGFGSSLFDYTNVTAEGVDNVQWILNPAITSPPDCFRGPVNPAFPLFAKDFLVTNGAVFAGVVSDTYAGEVIAWNIMYQESIPVTLLLSQKNVVQGYDFWATNMRTYVVTRFFNILIGKIDAEVFDFPCK
ncbi:hypothetical protein MMC11_006437 [Xylographa trunciseda]|nr:hypothetical protein [Xylographa trunciseda]